MPDLSHVMGNDLSLSATGDLATVDGTTFGEQRVLRRLLTNPQDYIFHPMYGAGLPNFVGQPADILRIKAVTRAQMFYEAAVARDPAPKIDVSVDPGTGTVIENIQYADAPSQQPVVLSFNLTG